MPACSAKLERYDAYRNAPASGRGNAARPPRNHWQETYACPSLERPFPLLLFVFAPAKRRAAPETREAAFHDRARPNWRITTATTTLHQLIHDGADRPVWRILGRGEEDRRALTASPKPRERSGPGRGKTSRTGRNTARARSSDGSGGRARLVLVRQPR